ncbi:uncharacterized protein LOC113942198, partial [Corapipo altera]|uniref:uncharacterized protein LOC113942198 n=1 Tax=Corapipo altera TaxID=415028 RepID=UPI000FD69008
SGCAFGGALPAPPITAVPGPDCVLRDKPGPPRDVPGLWPHFGVAMRLLRVLLLLGGLRLPPILGLLQEPPTEYTGPPGSYFGFALDFLMTEGRPSVAVGAPRANTSQPGVAQPGAVFLCSWPPRRDPLPPPPHRHRGGRDRDPGHLGIPHLQVAPVAGRVRHRLGRQTGGLRPAAALERGGRAGRGVPDPDGHLLRGDPGAAAREHDKRYCEIGFSAAVTP